MVTQSPIDPKAAPIDLKAHLAELFATALEEVAPSSADGAIVLDRPKQSGHGDFACSIALQLAKPLKRNPREIAQALVSALPSSPVLEKAEVAGAGFVNLFLKPGAKQRIVRQALEQGETFGRITMGRGRKAQVEFVSANPTGPLHVGHGRGNHAANVLGNMGRVDIVT